MLGTDGGTIRGTCWVCVDVRVQRSTDIDTTKGLSCNSIGDASYDVYLCLQDGQSPLMEALSGGNVECLQLLLDKGADVNQLYKVSSCHHEMRSLPYVHVYDVPLYEWSISCKVSLISHPSFQPQ